MNTVKAKMVLQDLLAVNLELQLIVLSTFPSTVPESTYRRMSELTDHMEQVRERIKAL